MKEATPTTQWISLFPPDEILALWKDCEKKGDHFDHMVTAINQKLKSSDMYANPEDIKKKCMDIRKGLNNAFNRMKKAAEEKGDVSKVAELQEGRRNIPKDRTGMGKQRANYESMLNSLSGSFGE